MITLIIAIVLLILWIILGAFLLTVLASHRDDLHIDYHDYPCYLRWTRRLLVPQHVRPYRGARTKPGESQEATEEDSQGTL